MSVVKRIIKDNITRVKVDELLSVEYEQAGYGGIQLTKTPLGTQINLFAMRPGRVIGKRGRAIKEASERLEKELGIPNPQITVIEVEVPELNPMIMASRVANALERGVHFRRAVFWSMNRIMDSGALGCEIVLKGPLRSARSRFEKVVEGYVPKAGDPALKYVKSATLHVKMKRGILGVTVNIVSPDAKFPDKVDLSQLPDIEYDIPVEISKPETAEPTEETKEEPVGPETAEETSEPAAEVVESESLPETEKPAGEQSQVPENEEAAKTPESDLVPSEKEEEAEPQMTEAEPESKPMPGAEAQEEAEEKPDSEEETQ